MPLLKELSFKSGPKYTVGQAFANSYTSTEREQLRQLLVSPDVFVSKSAAFSTKYLDIYDKYVLPATEGNIDVARRWHDAPMDFWQNQLNFATWCATTGCGVSVHDHLKGVLQVCSRKHTAINVNISVSCVLPDQVNSSPDARRTANRRIVEYVY